MAARSLLHETVRPDTEGADGIGTLPNPGQEVAKADGECAASSVHVHQQLAVAMLDEYAGDKCGPIGMCEEEVEQIWCEADRVETDEALVTERELSLAERVGGDMTLDHEHEQKSA